MMHLLLIFLLSISVHNATIYPIIRDKNPPIRIHYLGHSSFILFFDNGKSLLTDYGVSNSYGLNSPIYDLNDFAPDIVIYSHHDPDHDRGQKFPGAIVQVGINFSCSGIEINPLNVTKRKPDENYGYEISYKGLKIILWETARALLKPEIMKP